VYVSEPENNRISIFDVNGTLTNTFGEGQLNFPLGLAIDSEGKIFVVDRNSDRIQVFARR
jgi:DNA-binding beta-propeller fold protein YncE